MLGARHDRVSSSLAVDAADVRIVAIKPAWRGKGIIVRLEAPAPLPKPIRVQWTQRPISQACLCDARERDIRPLPVDAQGVVVPMDAAIVTLRLKLGVEPHPHPAL